MTCLPCAKEIIDSFAGTAWQMTEKMSKEMIPALVASGRLKPSAANQILNALIEADNKYIAAVQAAGRDLAALAAPPWPEAPGEEA